MNNIFAVPEAARKAGASEHFEALLTGPGGLLVERIVSHGQTTPEGEWYDQERDEWVVVLEGEARIGYADGSEITLGRGDHVFLPRHCKHRVTYASAPCIWLAVFGDEIRAHTGTRLCEHGAYTP